MYRPHILSAAGLIALSLAAVSLAGCGKKADQGPPPTKVVAASPLQKTIVDWDDYVGQFDAVNSVDVRPRVSGYLQSVDFKDGAIVRKGQLLFVIDPRPYQAALDQAKGQAAHAQAAAENAHTEAVRGQTLLSARAISQQAYDVLVAADRQAAADLVSAQAAVATAALNLGFTRVIAPLSGRISDRRIAPGNLVTADTTVLTNIADLNPIRFSFTASEALYLKYLRESAAGTRRSSREAANRVEVRLQDEPTYRWTGRMDFVDNVLDPGSGVIRGRAVIDNPTMFLTPGMFGHMRLSGSGAYPALLIPDRATVADQTRELVFVVGPDGRALARLITLGPLYRGLRVIRAGLNANDRVIIDGVQHVKAGDRLDIHTGQITPENEDAPAPSGGGQAAGDLTPLPTSATDVARAR